MTARLTLWSICIVALQALAPRLALARGHDVLYSFQGGADGAYPAHRLLNVGGTLYGTTDEGGVTTNNCKSGCGIVFAVTPEGAKTTIYAFQGGADGANPSGGLINIDGTLYGLTTYGGAANAGTVFAVTPSGTETVVYAFKGGSDGSAPSGELLAVGSKLYGTTTYGGGTGCLLSLGCGTVFRVTLGGSEAILHAFTCGADQASPMAGLISVHSMLYGTTEGGICGFGGSLNYGTVFQMDRHGQFNTLWTFGVGSDGANPEAPLIHADGLLYGTTAGGGGSAACNGGCGSVFSLTTAGAETVIHAFDGVDGQKPDSGLLRIGKQLFGTTDVGGADGNGVIFKVSSAGKGKTIHAFGGKNDGVEPYSVIDVNGTLYGTTSQGGQYGYGTVFVEQP